MIWQRYSPCRVETQGLHVTNWFQVRVLVAEHHWRTGVSKLQFFFILGQIRRFKPAENSLSFWRYFFAFRILPYQILTFVKYSSMEPFGFSEWTKIIIVPFLSCREGDVCAFVCLKNKCDKNESYLKNVEQKKKDSYWLTGRKDEWECDDVKGEGLCYSFDSNTEYGWVEDGKDVHIQGRVIKNPFQ